MACEKQRERRDKAKAKWLRAKTRLDEIRPSKAQQVEWWEGLEAHELDPEIGRRRQEEAKAWSDLQQEEIWLAECEDMT